MIDKTKQQESSVAKAKIYQRVHKKINMDKTEFIPAKKQIDYYDNDVFQRVAVYARVSTDSVQQTLSYELQRKYYEDFVIRHPNWTLTHIYSDEGISGTSLAHRDDFNRMISDCRTGKIDMIITKSVSRFSRNVVDCISIVRMLAELPQPVGVFFESECIFSLKDDSQMALSFQATMAQEESHIRSRSMETSLQMRLNNGLPLTPKLLGYSHDEDGNLIVNEEERPTVKLIFYMYLYGYSTAEIADTLTELGRKTYLGNVTWTSGAVVQILRNERHCGDVRTRKTFTPSYIDHKSKKNRGNRAQTLYYDAHEAIVSRDDFIAVQHMLDNAKYKNKSILPELRVIDSGILKGFVTVNPRWSGFKAVNYYQAAASIQDTDTKQDICEVHVEVSVGDFDMRGFEIARTELFDSNVRPNVVFQDKQLKLNTACVRKLGKNNHIELLVDPIGGRFAIRTTTKDNRHAVVCSKMSNGVYHPKRIACTAFMDTLYELFGWNPDLKYRAYGTLYENGNECAYIFPVDEAEAFIKPLMLAKGASDDLATAIEPLAMSGRRVRAVPEAWLSSFGKQYYLHRNTYSSVDTQSEEDWKIRMEGQLFECGDKLCVTGYEELKSYITQELSRGRTEVVSNG